MFNLIPRDVLCDPDEVFEVFVDIDSNLSMLKDAYLPPGHSIIIKCLFTGKSYCSLSQFTCSIFFFLSFSTSLKDKVNLEFFLIIMEHKY